MLRVLHLVSKEQRDGLDRLLATVDVVADEEEFLVAMGILGNLEKSEEVEVLPVHVSEHLDRCLQVE